MIDAHHSVRRILAACVLLLGAGSSAWADVAAILERGALPVFPQGVQGTWQEDAGRYAGPALTIDGRGTQSRFSLFETPRRLPAPDRYRAEAWVKSEDTGCQLDLVLFDGQGRERDRHTIVSLVSATPGPGWTYGACDVAVDEPVEGLSCNIEVLLNDARIQFDGVKVSTSQSILANGDFQFLDPPASGEKENKTPRGWRRMISPDSPGPQAEGSFAVEGKESERELVVTKGEGAFLLSATPVAIPQDTGSVVGRIHPRQSDAPAPGIVLRQYGMQGPLKENSAPRSSFASSTWERGVDKGLQSLVSSKRLPLASGADRLLLLLSFPRQAGAWRIRSVELIPLIERKPAIRIHTDQVGYDTGEPVRFVVESTIFPNDGIGTFTLKSDKGLQSLVSKGSLIPLGRTEGEHGSDWGNYYFEGVVNDVAPGVYTIEARVGDSDKGLQSLVSKGSLIPLGRTEGEHGSDWGNYYFEGALNDVAPGAYTIEARVGDSRKGLQSLVSVAPRLHLRETAELAYRFYSVQRCGCEVAGWHGPCHMDDAQLPDGKHVDVSGGYHNAGDMHKHMGDNTPVSVYAMVRAYESDPAFFDALDRDGNHRADILDEAVWGADWMRKMVDPATGRIWMNVTNDIDYWGIPEHDTDGIPGNRDDRVVNTNDPGDLGAFTIAAWAVLGRRLDANVYLDAARKLWAVYEDRILASYEPRQVFAAIELYRSTEDAKYRSMAEHIARRLLELQNAAGWFARAPGGPPEMKIVDEGVTPAALARFAIENPASPLRVRIRDSLRAYFAWAFRLADNPFGLLRNYAGGEPFFFKARDDWFGGANSEYLSTAWAAHLTAAVFKDESELAARLQALAANQAHWVLGTNPLDLCMFEGKGTSERIYFHHMYSNIPGHERGAVPGAIPNGITRPPDNSDRPWFDLRTGPGSPPGAESAEPWLPHNAYYLLMLADMKE